MNQRDRGRGAGASRGHRSSGRDAPRSFRPPADPDDPSRLSRFLALVLRHRAYQFDLEVDDEGFVSLPELLDVIHEQNYLDKVVEADLVALSEGGDRKRFEIQGDRIRATYGHSFQRLISYPTAEPPEQLYLGLAKSRLPQVRMSGLKPTGRQYLHLSTTQEEALEIGKHQDPDATVVTIFAKQAAEAGVPFYRPTQDLFLSPAIGPQYLDLEVSYGRTVRRSRRRP